MSGAAPSPDDAVAARRRAAAPKGALSNGAAGDKNGVLPFQPLNRTANDRGGFDE